MRTVILGAMGQLGRDLQPLFAPEAIPLTRQHVDLTDAAQMRKVLTELQPTVVINCAAYNFVDKAESEPEATFAVNAWAVRSLASICRDLGATLVHFSTDYVFGLDTQRTTPWKPHDSPGPVSVYGLSKLTGEYLVRSIVPQHFVIRTCGLYGIWGTGGKGGNFVETMLRVASQGKSLKVVSDQRCTPSFTADVAQCVRQLLETQAYGLYHITNAGDCSWFEFAATIFRLAGIHADLSETTSAAYNAPAKRPTYSVLDCDSLHALGIIPPRPWPEALADYLQLRSRSR